MAGMVSCIALASKIISESIEPKINGWPQNHTEKLA
jgi:hypothetical protein